MTKAEITVGREELLGRLHEVKPGLSPKEIVEQSNHFVFRAGEVVTFNQEVMCRAPSGLDPELTGAVQAKPLITSLEKMPDDEVRVKTKDGDLVVSGKRRSFGVHLASEIQLPTSAVEQPEKKAWRKLPADFADAAKVVFGCAAKDQSDHSLTCVHIAPGFMEACDRFQITRYAVETGVKASILIGRDAIKFVPENDFEEVAETENWIHFRTPHGLVLSCCRYTDPYKPLDEFLTRKKGTRVKFPKGLADALERALVFSGENKDDDSVLFELEPGKMRLRGEGSSGWAKEFSAVRYDGPGLKFVVSPKLMTELLQRHTDCVITPDRRLWVDGGKFVYVACLEEPKENTDGKEEEAS